MTKRIVVPHPELLLSSRNALTLPHAAGMGQK